MSDPIRLSDHRSNQPSPLASPLTSSLSSATSTAMPDAHSGSAHAGDNAEHVPAGPADPSATADTAGAGAGVGGTAHSAPSSSQPGSDDHRVSRDIPELPQVVNTTSTTGPLRLAEHPLNPSVTDKPIAWLCGVHGGAGVSTLTGILAPFKDSGGLIPAADDPNTTILVAATHKAGLRALHKAVLQFTSGASGPAELLGVIIVDHTPGKLPKALAGDVQRIREATPSHNLWHINYIPAWRCARARELPSWTPTAPGTPPQGASGEGKTKLSRSQRRDHADALRHVPEALATDAQDMFERSLRLYQRLNP